MIFTQGLDTDVDSPINVIYNLDESNSDSFSLSKTEILPTHSVEEKNKFDMQVRMPSARKKKYLRLERNQGPAQYYRYQSIGRSLWLVQYSALEYT